MNSYEAKKNFMYKIENATVNQEKKEELEKFFKSESREIYGFEGVELVTKGDKLVEIKTKDTFGMFYDADLFAQELADVLTGGNVRLMFTGDLDAFGYSVSQDRVELLVNVWLTEKEYDYVSTSLETFYTWIER